MGVAYIMHLLYAFATFYRWKRHYILRENAKLLSNTELQDEINDVSSFFYLDFEEFGLYDEKFK